MHYRYLFGFRGRINRGKYWLALLLSFAVMLIVLIPIARLSGAGVQHLSFHFGSLFEISGLPASGLLAWTTLTTPVAAILAWMFLATSVQRLHDRDRNVWWLVFFMAAPFLLNATGELLGRTYIAMSLQFAAIACNTWFAVEVFALRGTRGFNHFGPDPAATRAG